MEQAVILITGALAIWLTQQRNVSWQRYACLIGIIGQPYWLLATYEAEQWGMFGLSIFYSYSWLVGINNHWLKSRQPKPNN